MNKDKEILIIREIERERDIIDFYDEAIERLPEFNVVPIFNDESQQLKRYKGIIGATLDEPVPVSAGFNLVQHKEVLSALKEVKFSTIESINNNNGISVIRLQTAKNQTNIFCDIITRTTEVILEGDIIRSGIRITNSTIGSMRLMILPYIERLVCINGMVHKEDVFSKKFRHYGRNNLLANFSVLIKEVLDFFPTIANLYKRWAKTNIILTEPIYYRIKKFIPNKYLEDFALNSKVNMWDLFNHLTEYNTHDRTRNADTKHSFMRTIEKIIELIEPKPENPKLNTNIVQQTIATISS